MVISALANRLLLFIVVPFKVCAVNECWLPAPFIVFLYCGAVVGSMVGSTVGAAVGTGVFAAWEFDGSGVGDGVGDGEAACTGVGDSVAAGFLVGFGVEVGTGSVASPLPSEIDATIGSVDTCGSGVITGTGSENPITVR